MRACIAPLTVDLIAPEALGARVELPGGTVLEPCGLEPQDPVTCNAHHPDLPPMVVAMPRAAFDAGTTPCAPTTRARSTAATRALGARWAARLAEE